MKLRSLTPLKPKRAKRNKLEKDPIIPAVKKVHLEFDVKFIRSCLQDKRVLIENVNWPEVLYKLYKKCNQEENKLLHIESCCRKARGQIVGFKKQIERGILKYSPTVKKRM